jgi:hypothetical protein
VIDRRAFITMVGGSILAAPLAGEAQQAGKARGIGVLTAASPEGSAGRQHHRVDEH